MTKTQTDITFRQWIRRRVEEQPYFFHKIKVWDDLVTPGWSDPQKEKLPYYGLPERLDGMRVLDIGCAEGFFSFEAERRGASKVIAIGSFPDSIQRFGILKDAFGSKVTPYLCNVYELSPRTFGTFDLIMFFGVLYHVKHPWYALERIASVCSVTMLLQTLVLDDPQYRELSLSQFHPFGVESGPPENRQHDPTVFWVPTPECTKNLVRAVGMVDIVDVTNEIGQPYVLRAKAREISKGTPPDQTTAPWC